MITLEPSKTALLIIDIQRDFCSPKGVSKQKGRGIKRITRLVPRLEEFQTKLKELNILTIFTRYIRRDEAHTPENLNLLTKEAGLSKLCFEGTHGAEIYKLTPAENDIVIDKQYHDCFAGTDLLDILRRNQIQNVLITGVRTDICVDATAKRAFSEGFNSIIVSDMVDISDEREEVHHMILSTFKKYHGFVYSSEEILELLAG